MTMITPNEDEADILDLMLSVQKEVTRLRKQIETFTDEVRSGEETKPAEVRASIRDIRNALVECQKVERELHAARRQRSEIVGGGFALDLDAVRSEVGCALNRLRTCCGAGEVSG
ncbi:MAG: hypothetical protein AAGG57_13630 [Pseudomonadota bacterium]